MTNIPWELKRSGTIIQGDDFSTLRFIEIELKLRAEWFLHEFNQFSGTSGNASAFSLIQEREEISMKYALVIATVAVIATPALADEVGVRVGPVGAGVTVGESHDRFRDRDHDRTTVIREREPAERTTVIKRDHDDGVRTKTIIKERD